MASLRFITSSIKEFNVNTDKKLRYAQTSGECNFVPYVSTPVDGMKYQTRMITDDDIVIQEDPKDVNFSSEKPSRLSKHRTSLLKHAGSGQEYVSKCINDVNENSLMIDLFTKSDKQIRETIREHSENEVESALKKEKIKDYSKIKIKKNIMKNETDAV